MCESTEEGGGQGKKDENLVTELKIKLKFLFYFFLYFFVFQKEEIGKNPHEHRGGTELPDNFE